MVLVIVGVQIFVPCFLGTFLTNSGEKYYASLCSISWNLLHLKDQKSLSILLVHAKHPRSIKMGPYFLNLPTFVEVSRNYKIFFIHSFFRSVDLQSYILVLHDVGKRQMSQQKKALINLDFSQNNFFIIYYLLRLSMETLGLGVK